MESYLIRIKEGKERNLIKGHPWVFSGAIESLSPCYREAAWARVETISGLFIAWGWYDEKSHIPLRLISWREGDEIGDALIKRLVRESVRRRSDLFHLKETNAFRIIFGDADFLSGVTADIYAKEIRVVISSRFGWRMKDVIKSALMEMLRPERIIIMIDPNYASTEGLREEIEIYNSLDERIKRENAPNVRFCESGIYYELDGVIGQKSGFYLDQRDNRNIVEYYASGRRVLDAFCYTGSFTLHALRGHALSVKALDSSEGALRHLLYQVHLNENKGAIEKDSIKKVETERADVFEKMREIPRNTYDMIILDPPKLASTKGSLEKAEKAYKDVNRVAMEKIQNNGILVTFSCSGAMTRERFKLVIAWAAKDAGVEAQILNVLSQGEDHPIRLSFPESEYLTGLVLRVIKK